MTIMTSLYSHDITSVLFLWIMSQNYKELQENSSLEIRASLCITDQQF